MKPWNENLGFNHFVNLQTYATSFLLTLAFDFHPTTLSNNSKTSFTSAAFNVADIKMVASLGIVSGWFRLSEVQTQHGSGHFTFFPCLHCFHVGWALWLVPQADFKGLPGNKFQVALFKKLKSVAARHLKATWLHVAWSSWQAGESHDQGHCNSFHQCYNEVSRSQSMWNLEKKTKDWKVNRMIQDRDVEKNHMTLGVILDS